MNVIIMVERLALSLKAYFLNAGKERSNPLKCRGRKIKGDEIMTLVTKDGNYKIIDGELFKEVVSPDGMVYLERYIGEEITIDDIEEVR